MNRRKSFVLIAMAALLLTFTVSGTIAWLAASTDPVVNTFTPGQVPPDIIEDTDTDTKNSIQVKNNGNVAAYIRVAIVANWHDASGNVVGSYTGEIKINTAKWFEEDGYYYYISPVGAGVTTDDLLAENAEIARGDIPVADYPNAKELKMTVITQSIQADGTTVVGNVTMPVVTAEWGVQVDTSKNLVDPTPATN